MKRPYQILVIFILFNFSISCTRQTNETNQTQPTGGTLTDTEFISKTLTAHLILKYLETVLSLFVIILIIAT